MSNLLIGVFGALAVAATGAALKWGKQALARIREAVLPDHRALYQQPGWGLMAVQSGGLNSVRMVIACAPSRSLRRAAFSPDAAIGLIRSQFPGRFPDQPAASDLRTGMDILRPVAQMAEAMASPAYAQAFGRPRWPSRRRFDWFIGVGGEFARDDGCTVPWDDLDFPGRRPQRAGTRQYPYCPPSGFAKDQLRSWNPKHPAAELLRAFLEDFLQTNGYHDVSDAIADTIEAFTTGRGLLAADPPAQVTD